MNAPVMLYNLAPAKASVFEDLTIVRILDDVMTDDAIPVPAGTLGTIVAEWGDGAAYEVEFKAGLATVDVRNLIAADAR